MTDQLPAKRPFSVIAKPIGAKCNLNCTYCFYLEKDVFFSPKPMTRMSTNVLQKYIQNYIASQPGDHVTFAWQGGEPTLLGASYFRKVVDLQRLYAQGKTIDNAFQTNGVLVDDEWCELFKDGNFLIGISIDGPEDLHDRYRVNKGGGGTFAQVMRGLECLKNNKVEFNTLTVLHRDNVEDPLRIYRFLKSVGSRFQQYIPILERAGTDGTEDGLSLVSPAYAGTAKVTDWSLSAEQYGHFLTTIFDYWVRHDVGQYFVQLFDSTLATWMGHGAQICIHQETCGGCLALEHNGDLYSCDHYVYPAHRVGNIMEDDLSTLASCPKQTNFGRDKFDNLTLQCRTCSVRALCNGGCPKHRIGLSREGEPGQNQFCEAYFRFFTHSTPYMHYMAQALRRNRPAADVMAWSHEKDRGFPQQKAGRNDPCPCGSGKKFKICCAC